MQNVELKVSILKKLGSQIVLARKTGINEERISRFIHGRSKPSEDEKKLIASALEVGVCKIFPNEHCQHACRCNETNMNHEEVTE